MHINVMDDKKLVEIWLSNAEKNNRQLRIGLQDIYKKYSSKKYLVAVFESGEKDLCRGTVDLLVYNKRRMAEMQARIINQTRIQ